MSSMRDHPCGATISMYCNPYKFLGDGGIPQLKLCSRRLQFTRSTMSCQYNVEEASPSPADYNMRSELSHGYSISKSARFSSGSSEEENTMSCPRMAQHSTRLSITSSDNELYAKNLETLKRNALGFSTSDSSSESLRKIPAKAKEDIFEQSESISPIAINLPKEVQPLYKREEHSYIEDNYESFTSSEELDDLRSIEEYEFNEVCKAIRRSSERYKSRDLVFEGLAEAAVPTILQKLQVIEEDVNVIKNDLSKMKPKKHGVSKKNPPQLGINNTTYVYKHQSEEMLRSKVKAAINKAMENLEREVELKRKLMLETSETGIRNVMKEIHQFNEKSSKQVRKACKKTLDQFMNDLEPLMESNEPPVLEYPSEIHNVFIGEEAVETHEEFYKDVCSGILDQDIDIGILEPDDLNIATKYSGTTDMLDTQGALIEILKNELADLKSSLNTKKF